MELSSSFGVRSVSETFQASARDAIQQWLEGKGSDPSQQLLDLIQRAGLAQRSPAELATLRSMLAWFYAISSKPDAARQLCRESKEAIANSGSPTSAEWLDATESVAIAAKACGEFALAEEMTSLILSHKEDNQTSPSELVPLLNVLAELANEQSNHAKAESLWLRCLEILANGSDQGSEGSGLDLALTLVRRLGTLDSEAGLRAILGIAGLHASSLPLQSQELVQLAILRLADASDLDDLLLVKLFDTAAILYAHSGDLASSDRMKFRATEILARSKAPRRVVLYYLDQFEEKHKDYTFGSMLARQILALFQSMPTYAGSDVEDLRAMLEHYLSVVDGQTT